MTTVKFTKMQGLGNDFIIMDYTEYEKTEYSMAELAKKINYSDTRKCEDEE